MSVKSTTNSDTAPWKSYNAAFEEKLDPQLEREIAEYASKVHSKSSSQNEEELARQKEINNAMAEEYRWLHPEEYKDEAARKGKIIHSSTFISTLRNNGIQCWYRNHPQPKKLTLLFSKYYGVKTPEVACWVQSGFMPELSIMSFDDHGVPLAEKFRGWRTVILQLILKGVITEVQANEWFGKAKTSFQYHRYNSVLKSFRTK